MKVKNKIVTIIFATLLINIFLLSQKVLAEVDVVTSVPDLAAITKAIGKDKVKVESLAKGYQDPHFVDAKPSYVLKLNRADLLIYNGLDLETGWLPVLITGSRNSKITSPNADGNLDASTLITNVLEVPDVPVDRSMGDVHPRGNPHYLLDPRNGITVARGIAERLGKIDPENSSFYELNYQQFKDHMVDKIATWEQELSGMQGAEIITYHKLWVYFNDWTGFREVNTIEPKPGIPPSPSHVAKLVKDAGSQDISFVLAANYYPEKTAKVVASRIGVPFVRIPVMVGGTGEVNSYSDLFEVIVGRITESVEK